MKYHRLGRRIGSFALLGGVGIVAPLLVHAAPAGKAKTTSTTRAKTSAKSNSAKGKTAAKPAAAKGNTRSAEAAKAGSAKAGQKKSAPLPRFVSIDTLQTLRALRGDQVPRLIDPAAPALPELANKARVVDFDQVQRNTQQRQAAKSGGATRIAQLPGQARQVRPANPRARTVTPKWVRYPFESQLCGIGIGTRAVNKDRFNRIDRYGLFAMHGNPTAVVVPVVQQNAASAGGAAGGAGAPGGAAGGPAGPGLGGPGLGGPGAAGPGAPGAGGGVTAAAQPANLTVQQQPPLAATLFSGSDNGELPDWASAVAVTLDDNHVQWLYNRGTYAMGFVVDRLGYVDAIVVAGVESPIARTQFEDPVHTVKLGDDLRKVLFRYGYPDTIETYGVTPSASVSFGNGGGAAAAGGPDGAGGVPGAGAPGAAGPGAPGAGGPGGGAAGGGTTNAAFQTFELRYEQSYNIVFTIRYNRVVRMYIFGDPDFFNEQRRKNLRTSY